MYKHFAVTCALLAAICQHSFAAETLMMGSKAPKLEVKKFLKGDEVKGFQKGKIYVVELWATWCGPCLQSIPHLTELQKKFEDVSIIGIAVLQEDQDIIPEFVEKMGDKMKYRVAMDLVPEDGDPQEGKIVKNWMEPAEVGGIPTAFVINGDGVIAWIGHPAELEEPLEKIVTGKWDIAAEVKKVLEAKELQAKMEKIFTNLQQLFQKFGDDDEPAELLKALDSATAELPDRATQFRLLKLKVLSASRAEEALKLVNEMMDSELGEDAQALDGIAWMIVDPDRDKKADPRLLKIALKAAQKADNLTNNESPSVSDTLAKAYFDNGDLAKAVQTQERTMELVEGKRMAADPNLRKRLRQYRKALEAAQAKEKEGGAAKTSSQK